MEEAMMWATPDEAAAFVQQMLDADDAERKGMFEPEPQLLWLPKEAVRALLLGYEAAVSDIRTLEHGSLCMICRYKHSALTDLVCADCKGTPHVITDNFEWRGLGPGGRGEETNVGEHGEPEGQPGTDPVHIRPGAE